MEVVFLLNCIFVPVDGATVFTMSRMSATVMRSVNETICMGSHDRAVDYKLNGIYIMDFGRHASDVSAGETTKRQVICAE